MKPAVSPYIRQHVLELRRSHSLRTVAERTSLPLGTVKTICSRSGAFRDNEARSRFGDDLFAETPAESFCITALHGAEPGRYGSVDDEIADERFEALPDLLPHTLSDCLRELVYWSDLYRLRNSVDSSDGPPEANARKWFVFRMLGRIRPRSKAEALAVLRWMLEDKQNNMGSDDDADAILLNLIG